MTSPSLLQMPTGIVRHTIPADPSLVGPLRQRFIDTIANGSLAEQELTQWKLVFSEMMFNAISHGARGDRSLTVHIEWSITQNAIIIAAQDPGPGPSEESLRSPKLPDDPTAESGRGLFILSSFADELHHWRGPSGFRIELVKRYPTQGLPLPGNPELDSVLDELSTCYESLSVFHRLAENLIESSNLSDFIGGSLNDYLSLHPQDRIFFQGASTIPSTIRTTLGPASWFLDPDDADTTLRALGSLTRETVWENADDLERQNITLTTKRSIGSGCVFPIVASDLHFGALIVLRNNADSVARARSLGTLRTLADLCGIACANTHLSSIRDESQKDLRELEIAVGIQKALLPIIPPPLSDRWLACIHQDSSLTIAGDYAIAKLDASGNLVAAIIDVMGKGVSAALLASIFKTAFDLSLNLGSSSEILETINRTLCNQLGNLTMFITCAITRVSADGRLLDHASAGHCPTFFYQKDGSRRFLQPSGPPLGILPEVSYACDRFPLQGGERLVFITDGCYEWDRTDEDFGWQKFVEHVDHNRSVSSQQLWDGLRDRIRQKCGAGLEDDCTLLTIDIS